jgi:hypothetical protein
MINTIKVERGFNIERCPDAELVGTGTNGYPFVRYEQKIEVDSRFTNDD